MKRYPYKLLFRSIVRPFYRENLSIFFFLFILFFGVEGEVDGAELWQFHYSLVKGMTGQGGYILVVFAAWGWYAWKCGRFVTGLFVRPEYRWIAIYNSLERGRRLGLLLLVNGWLMLPVLLYGMIVSVIGLYDGFVRPGLLVGTWLSVLVALR